MIYVGRCHSCSEHKEPTSPKKATLAKKITQTLTRRKPAIMIQTISDMQQWTGDVGRQAAYFAVNKHMKACGRNEGEQNDSPEGGR